MIPDWRWCVVGNYVCSAQLGSNPSINVFDRISKWTKGGGLEPSVQNFVSSNLTPIIYLYCFVGLWVIG